MTISRRSWEPELQNHRDDSERGTRHSFDLDTVLSLTIGGGEFANFAELCAVRDVVRGLPAPTEEHAGTGSRDSRVSDGQMALTPDLVARVHSIPVSSRGSIAPTGSSVC